MTIEQSVLWRNDRRAHWPRQETLVVPYRTTKEADTTLSLEQMRAQLFQMFWGFAEGSPAAPAPGSVNHYFQQVSSYEIALWDSTNTFVTHGDYFISNQEKDYELAPNQKIEEAMRAKLLEVIDPEVDYRQYARNNRADTRDLIVVMVNRSGTGTGGTVRGTRTIPVHDGVTLTLKIAAFGNSASFAVATHEIVHTLVPQNTDLYGPGSWNSPASLMGSSPPRGVSHLDGPQKLRLGWRKPRPVDIATPTSETFRLRAQTLTDNPAGERDPLVIYDSARGRREFFVLEFRTPTARSARPVSGGDYDSNLNEAGLAVWHAETDGSNYTRRPAYINLAAVTGRSPQADSRDLLIGRTLTWGKNATLNTRPQRNVNVKLGPPINLVAAPDGDYGYKSGFWTAANGDIQLQWPGDEPLRATIAISPAQRDADSIDVTISTPQCSPLDAAIVHPNGKAYFFKDHRYQRFDFESDEVDKIAIIHEDGWKRLWPGLDAGLMHPNGKAYFFKGEHYQRYVFGEGVDKVGEIGRDGWRGVWPDVDAGLVHPNGKAYFFKGEHYQRYVFGEGVDKEGEIGVNGWSKLRM